MKNSVRYTATIGMLAALAIVLSYLESLIPPISASLPGIKMGLPNIIIIFALYRMGVGAAATVSAVRLLCVSLLFGNITTFWYSLAGAILSLTLMSLLRRFATLSPIGVSIAGGVAHNAAQICVAVALLGRAEISYYFFPLILSGTVAGVIVGIAGHLLIKRIPKKLTQSTKK